MEGGRPRSKRRESGVRISLGSVPGGERRRNREERGKRVLTVILKCCASFQNICALKAPPSGMTTWDRHARAVSRPHISPCTWKSGITSKETSFGPNSYVFRMLPMEAQMLAWVRGTPLGLLVVPEV